MPGTDINYTFGYVGIANRVIDYTGNCGNTSAAVGPFALLRGLIKPVEPMTKVRIYNTNTKKVILAEFRMENGEFVSEGDFRIDGVPGSGSKILLDFIGSGGSVTGKLLQRGRSEKKSNSLSLDPSKFQWWMQQTPSYSSVPETWGSRAMRTSTNSATMKPH